MTELFTIPESKSPRLLWMEKYDVTIVKSGHKDIEPDPEGDGDWYPFTIYSGPIFNEEGEHLYGPCGQGLTEDEAFAGLAKCLKVKLWNEE